MSTIYRGLPQATYFNQLCRFWHGTGVVFHMTPDDSDDTSTVEAMLSGLNAHICKLYIGLPDPGADAAGNDATAMQDVWANAGLELQVQTLFASLVRNNYTTVLLSVAAPRSWMSLITSTLTGTDSLSSYVRYVCGCIAWLRATLTAPASTLIKFVEVYEEPDTEIGHVSPLDVAALTSMLHTALSASYGTEVQVSGPAVSQVVSVAARGEPYVEAYQNRSNSLGLFTYHVEVNTADAGVATQLDASVSDGCCIGETLLQRDLMCRSLERNVMTQNSVVATPMTLNNTAWAKERFATSWGKTTRPAVSPGRTEAECYAIGAARTMCAMLLNGFSATCFHRLVAADDGVNGIYNSAAELTAWGSFYARLGAELPLNGQLYVSEEMSPGDNTLKSLVLSPRGDKFAIILCRPETSDALNGMLRVIIRNPLWSDQYQVSGLTLESFPSRDVSTVQTSGKIGLGQGVFTFSMLPYESTVFLVTGQVLLNPPIVQPPPPPEDNFNDDGSRLETIIQVPINYGNPVESSTSTPVPGSLYYDTEDNVAKVYIGSQWVNVTMLS